MFHHPFVSFTAPRLVLWSIGVGFVVALSVQPAVADDTCGTGAEELRMLRAVKAAKADGNTQDPSKRQAATSSPSELPVFTVLLELEGSGVTFSEAALTELPGLVYGTPSEAHPDGPPLSVAQRFAVESYGQLAVTGIEGNVGSADDIIGPFSVSSFSCTGFSASMQPVIDAHEDSVDWSPLETGAQLLVLFPGAASITCAFGGGATTAVLNSDDFTQEDERYPVALSLHLSSKIIAHELGHILGSGHAGVIECHDDGWLDIPYEMNTSGLVGDAECATRAYGDFRSFMGTGGQTQFLHSGAAIKEQLGFFSTDDSALHRVELVTESGDYELVPLSEENLGGVKALKFPSGQGEYAYVEIRSPYNADGSTSADYAATSDLFLSHSNMFAGAHVSRSYRRFFESSLLLDGQITSLDPPLVSQFTPQFALPYTQSYTDPLSGTEITIGFPPTFGPVNVQVDIGRTDFTGPVISDLQVTDHSDDPCSAIVSAHVEDPAGLSAIALRLDNVAFTSEPVVVGVPLPGDDGWLEVEVDRRLVTSDAVVSLQAWDDASSVGYGLADDTYTRSVSVDLPQNPDCDTAAPQVDLVAPEPGEEFDGWVAIQFDVMENESAILTWWYSIRSEGAPVTGNIEYLDESMQWMEVDDEHLLPPGDYTLSYGAVDIYGHFSDAAPVTFTVVPRETFLRGDTNDDGLIDIADVTTLMGYLYSGGSLACMDAADTNDDGLVNLADGVVLNAYLRGEGSLPAPSRGEGEDPTADTLACAWVVP